MAVKQTAGRDALGEFAPKFAELNDEVLFGQVWSREDKLSLRDRSLVTVVALMAQGLTDSSFRYHLTAAKNNGITRTEIAEILTHAAFYVGWPKAWAAFRMAKEVWAEDAAEDAKAKHQSEMVFPIGASNDGFAQYFSGKSYLAPLSTAQVGIYNVTFEPGCRNNWHIHHAAKGGGQILVCVAGRGYYQEWGKAPLELHPGDVVNIPPEVKHWHGAAPDCWFSHLAVEVPGEGTSNEWCEPMPEQLAHPSCRKGWRADSCLRGRPGLLSGMGQSSAGAASGRCGEHSPGGQALARCCTRLLVLSSGSGSAR